MTAMPLAVLWYLLTLLVYTPGLLIFANRRRSLCYPVTSFTFLGLFVFNALGSLFVLVPELTGRDPYYSVPYLVMLNGQAVIFYLFAIPYICGTQPVSIEIQSDDRVDGVYVKLLMLLIGGIVGLYLLVVGLPPLAAILTGGLNMQQMLSIRTATLFGRSDFWFFNLGFTTLPIFTAIYALGRFAKSPRTSGTLRWVLPASLGIASLPGGKGNILEFGVAMLIAYYLISGWAASRSESSNGPVGGQPLKFSYRKVVFLLAVGLLSALGMYRLYYGPSFALPRVVLELTNRIIGVYSESMAATAAFAEQHGFMEGQTLPTIRGLLGHTRINVETTMHFYMFGTPGSVTVPATAEGYINFGWTGFVLLSMGTFASMIVVEQTLLRMPRNMLTISLLVFYSILATKVSQISLFATFVSLTYCALFGLLIFLRTFVCAGFGVGRVVREV